MATSTPGGPVAQVSRITTAALTAASVGTGLAVAHLAADHGAAAASPSASAQPLDEPDGSSWGAGAGQGQGQGQWQGFSPVAPPGAGGGAPQARTSGS